MPVRPLTDAAHRRSRSTTGAAMCASWRTPCTAPCCWRSGAEIDADAIDLAPPSRAHPTPARRPQQCRQARVSGLVGRAHGRCRARPDPSTLCAHASATARTPRPSSASRSARCATSCAIMPQGRRGAAADARRGSHSNNVRQRACQRAAIPLAGQLFAHATRRAPTWGSRSASCRCSRAHPAAAAARARFRPGALDHRLGAGADGGDVPRPPARFLQLPHAAAAHHALAAVAERRHRRGSSSRTAARARSPPATWSPAFGGFLMGGDLRDRADRLRHPAGGEFRRHHQGLRPHRRGGRAVQPGCDARQADGDRRRSFGRHYRRTPRARAAQGIGGGKRFLRRHGRRGEIRARRRYRRADHHHHQYPRRHHHRHRPARHELRRCGRRLHHADGRRRPGHADPRAAGVDRRRHRRHQGRHGRYRRCRADTPARQHEAARARVRRGCGDFR